MAALVGCKPTGGGPSLKIGGSSSSSNNSSSSGALVSLSLGSASSGFASGSSNTNLFVPSSLDNFDCFAVNVVASDIKQVPVCGGTSSMGVAVGFFRRGTNIQMNVPYGTNRTFQVWGFANSNNCADVVSLITTPRGVNPAGFGSAGYVLAERTLNVGSRTMTVDLTPSFSSTAPVFCGVVPNPVTTIVGDVARYAPGVEGSTFANGAAVRTAVSPAGFCLRYTTTATSPEFTCYLNNVETACAAGPCLTNWASAGQSYGVQHISGLAEGSYTFKVTTRDTTLGLSDLNPPTFSFEIDDSNPTITIQGISPGSYDAGTLAYYTNSTRPTMKVRVASSATRDENSVIRGAATAVAAGGTAFALNAATASCVTAVVEGVDYDCPLTTTTGILGVGSNTVQVYATDPAGNTSAVVGNANNVVLDQTAPVCSVTPPIEAGVTTVSWPMGGDLTGDAFPAITEAGGYAASSFICALNGGSQSACPTGPGFTFTEGGKQTIRMFAKDFAGNVSSIVNATAYVDTLTGGTALGRINLTTKAYKVDDSAIYASNSRTPDNVGFYAAGQVALDTVYNRLFVVDTSNHRVLVFQWNSTTKTVASHKAIAVLGQYDFEDNITGDANLTVGATTYTPFNSPTGIALNPAGTSLFVADTGNNRILRFNIYDTAQPYFINKQAQAVFGQASDVGSTANFGSGCGRDNITLPETGGADLARGLCEPRGLAFYDDGANGRLYVADKGNCRVAFWDNATTAASGAVITSHLGANGQPADGSVGWMCGSRYHYTTSGPASIDVPDANSLMHPYAVAVDTAGTSDATDDRVYVTDTHNNRVAVWAITADAGDDMIFGNDTGTDDFAPLGQDDQTFWDNGDGTINSDDTPANPHFSFPTSVAIVTDTSGNRYVAVGTGYQNFGGEADESTDGTPDAEQEFSYPKIKFFLIDYTASTYTYQATWNTTGPSTSKTSFRNPSDVAFDATNSVAFVADAHDNRVGIFRVGSTIISDEEMDDVLGHLDSTGQVKSYTASSINNANDSKLNEPTYAVADSFNNRLYVSDTENNRILVFALNPTNKKPAYYSAFMTLGVANSGLSPDTSVLNAIPTDHITGGYSASNTTLKQPRGLALDSNRNLWVADSGNHRILRFPTNTARFTTDGTGRTLPIVADVVLGQTSFTASTAAVLSSPTDVAFDSTGNRLFVSDTGNDRIVFYTSVTSIAAGTTHTTKQQDATVLGGTCLDTNADIVLEPSPICLEGPTGLEFTQALTDSTTSATIFNRGLLVADTGNHRVVYYDLTAAPVAGQAAAGCFGKLDNAAPANSVTDQCTETAPTANNDGGAGAAGVASDGTVGLSSPRDILIDTNNNYLYISDTGNSRVVVYNLEDTNNQPTVSAASFAASNTNFHVIGQQSQTAYAAPPTLGTPAALRSPVGLFRIQVSSYENLLFIVDEAWNRSGLYEVP